MPINSWIRSIVVPISLVYLNSVLHRPSEEVMVIGVTAFAAGGFGASSKENRNNRHVAEKTKRKKKGLEEFSSGSKTISGKSSQSTSNDQSDRQQKLDKWGLPVATLDDIFPPLQPDTELVPVDASKEYYSVSEIQERLKNHIDLDLSRFFSENSNGKVPNEDGSTVMLRLLHQSPPVLAFDNFLTASECKHIQEQSKSPTAHEVDSATFQGSLSTRTSTSWFCHYSDVPVLLAKANKLLNIPLEAMEEPQIVRYERGQEFSWHYDEIPSSQLNNGGQRLATLLIYLTSVPENMGGGTTFRDLQTSSSCSSAELVMQPQQGSALLFFPAFRDGQADDRTLHKSQIMEWDKPKWIVQMWVHQREYQAVLPAGNSNQAARLAMEEASERLGYS